MFIELTSKNDGKRILITASYFFNYPFYICEETYGTSIIFDSKNLRAFTDLHFREKYDEVLELLQSIMPLDLIIKRVEKKLTLVEE